MEIRLDCQLSTPRCLLRIRGDEDNELVFSATRDPDFNTGLTWEAPSSIEELAGRSAKVRTAWQEGRAYNFTIVSQANGDGIGMISVRRDSSDRDWSIGYWIHPSHQGMGYATEATEAILNFAFHHLDAAIVTAQCALWNTRSERVLQRAGFSKTGETDQGFKKRGKWIPESIYSVRKQDWLGRESGVLPSP